MRKARMLTIHLGDNEYGNSLMRSVAQEAFDNDPTLDAVEVVEHGGWWMEWNREFLTVGTANDTAVLSPAAHRWAAQFSGIEYVGTVRRGQEADWLAVA